MLLRSTLRPDLQFSLAAEAMQKAEMERLQLEWAAQVVHTDDAKPWRLDRIGGLDVHWVDDTRGESTSRPLHDGSRTQGTPETALQQAAVPLLAGTSAIVDSQRSTSRNCVTVRAGCTIDGFQKHVMVGKPC